MPAAGTAVVAGGSLAGLCAARVLTDHFERVVLVDRDAFPEGPEDRAGVPQARHIHVLLAGGRRELEALFPGFEAGMRNAGALEIDFPWDIAALRAYGWAPRERSGMSTFSSSRRLLEWVIRELLRQRPNLDLLERTEVDGLELEPGARRVAGVRLRSRDGGQARDLEADLLVDACGRSSKAPDWLERRGCERPRETVVDSHAGYSTRWYRAPDPRPERWWWRGVWIDLVFPDQPTAGVLFPCEDELWTVTLAAAGGLYPPTDEEGFTAKLKELRSPAISDMVARATPVSSVHASRQMANRFRHYESCDVPAGFAAVGDAVCAFNPVYGQGMSTAAACARILGETLAREGATPRFPRRFFRAQARFLQQPWVLASGADFSFPGTRGDRPLATRVVEPYMRAFTSGSATSRALRMRFGEVLHLLRPVSSLFAPPIAARVALHAVGRGVRRGAPAPVPDQPPESRARERH